MNSAFTHAQSTTNNNAAVLQPHDSLMQKLVEEVVEFRLNSCLLYRVQCVSCEEAAVLLSVDTDTVRNWIKINKLTASKIGREWSIRVMDIDKMLTSNTTVIKLDDKRFKRNKKAC